MAISTAISPTELSRVVGYKIKAGSFSPNTGNLPQRIVLLGEANDANQGEISTTPFEFTSAKQVGDKYGYGSPLYAMARILRPISGNLLGDVQTLIYAQASDESATVGTTQIGIAVATSVTKTTTHYLKINGRDGVDGERYAFTVTKGDAVADVQDAMVAAVNNVLGSPVVASEETADVLLTSKWKGATAKITFEVDTDGEDAGIVYSETSTTDGTGTVTITTALASFANNWNTIVVNPYGTDYWDDLEAANGVPDPNTPTGRYIATLFKPFVALTGITSKTLTNYTTYTDAAARKDQVTNVVCPAPGSDGFEFEAAANGAVTFALLSTLSPHIGNGGVSYNDMPVPTDEDIGDMGEYVNRSNLAKKGCSTVNLVNGKYTIQDFQTTYHPDGEAAPKFRKVRDLIVHWNLEFRWRIVMERDIQDKAIVSDTAAVRVSDTISPKQVKQLIYSFLSEAQKDALIADLDFAQESVQVEINSTNPARIDIFFRYKNTSTADIVSTDAEFDFFYSIG